MQETLPPQTAEGAGFELTRVRQFTIFIENKVGRLQLVLRAVEEGVGRIVALMIEECGETALIRMICAEPDYARELLRTAGLPFSETEVLVVAVPQKGRQPLLSICSALLAAEINIHYTYPLFRSPAGPAMALYLDDPTLAAQLLIRKGFTLVSEGDLRKQ